MQLFIVFRSQKRAREPSFSGASEWGGHHHPTYHQRSRTPQIKNKKNIWCIPIFQFQIDFEFFLEPNPCFLGQKMRLLNLSLMVVGSCVGSLCVRLTPAGSPQNVLLGASAITWGVILGDILIRRVYPEDFESLCQPKRSAHPFISYSWGTLLGVTCQQVINELKN